MIERPITTEQLAGALQHIKNLRKWAVDTDANPWAIRQALIMALDMDTHNALKSGVNPEDLAKFDAQAKAQTSELISRLDAGIGE